MLGACIHLYIENIVSVSVLSEHYMDMSGYVLINPYLHNGLFLPYQLQARTQVGVGRGAGVPGLRSQPL